MKEFLIIIEIIIFMSCFLFASIALYKWITLLRKRKIGKKSYNSSFISKTKLEPKNDLQYSWILRNGISFLKAPSKFLLNKVNYINKLLDFVLEILEENNIQSNKESLLSIIIFIAFFFAIIVSILFNSVIAGIAVVVCFFVCFVLMIKSSIDKRSINIRNSIPDALRSMSVCFGAGYTLFQTFDVISKESKGSLKKLFTKSSHILQTGGSISESLSNLKSTKEAPELAFVAVALDVQHQTGGSIRPVIDSAKEMVESKLDLLRKLQVQTAQAKLSARIVIILPFLLIAVFSIVSPNFLVPFFSSPLGVFIFCIACLMQAAGIILVKKILNVNV